MKKISQLKDKIEKGSFDQAFMEIYLDEGRIAMEKSRYIKALCEFENLFGDCEVEIYSAPGRSEIGGNHTDHQHGKVLTGAVNIDAIAVVAKTDDLKVDFRSEGYPGLEVDLSKLEPKDSEKETTASLIRGVAAGAKKRGFNIGGFKAYVTSEVLSGSGLSSSAAIEILLATIFSGLFNDGAIDSVTKAQIGQEAENIFFGKPSGLLDQMGCSVGGLVFIDFNDPGAPEVKKVDVDFESFGHSLCVVDTKGSHADLTDEYASIPEELKKVCEVFNKSYLREVSEEDFYNNISKVRAHAGDRAVLRAIHIFDDNKRVDEQTEALTKGDFSAFKNLIRESGNSSYKYLQNVYSGKKPEDQSVSVALVMTNKILGKDCACRVQGGGFAGTIEVFIPNEDVAGYKKEIEKVFGEGACHVLKIRSMGGIKVM